MTKMFDDYMVVLHDRQKRSKNRTITKCVSESAAVRVADVKERLEKSFYRGSMVYPLDAEGKPIWK